MYPTNATCAPNSAAGSCRANLEWRTNTYGPAGSSILRRTLYKVYAVAGETIMAGSSAVGVNNGDIIIYNPGRVTGSIGNEAVPAPAPATDFLCSAQRTASGLPNQGQILSRAQEQAGADTVPASIAGAYQPCTFIAPATGIYDVVFYGPVGVNANADGGPTADINLAAANNFMAIQGSSIAAWDVTVRPNPALAATKPGRLFSYGLALYTGGNGLPLNSTVYVSTLDGYLYRTNLNGLDPNGFLIYGNSQGYYDSDGVTPLYHDVLGSNGPLATVQGGVSFAPPKFPVFANTPDPVVLTNLAIPLTPVIPTISNLSFTGSLGGNNTRINAGGTFGYTGNIASTVEIVISRDGINFDPANLQNRLVRGIRPAGNQTIPWDGLDNSGVAFPVGKNYQVRATIRAGEYHFPLIDAENSTKGGPSYTLLNSPIAGCSNLAAGCSTAYYDDRGYRTLNNTTVGTLNTVLCGLGPPNPAANLVGYDSTSNLRKFGQDTGGNVNTSCAANGSFGDTKGLDLWTYSPSTATNAVLNIFTVADIEVKKTATPTAAIPGQNVTFVITVTNLGIDPATGISVTDQLTSGLTFVSATPSLGTYNSTSGVWLIGNLAINSPATLQIVATLNQCANLINIARKTGEDQFDPSGGSDPNAGNNFGSASVSCTPTPTPTNTSAPTDTAGPGSTPTPTFTPIVDSSPIPTPASTTTPGSPDPGATLTPIQNISPTTTITITPTGSPNATTSVSPTGSVSSSPATTPAVPGATANPTAIPTNTAPVTITPTSGPLPDLPNTGSAQEAQTNLAWFVLAGVLILGGTLLLVSGRAVGARPAKTKGKPKQKP